jgi:arabinogalactan oligomer/maltooligosaccharide transport system permease protein
MKNPRFERRDTVTKIIIVYVILTIAFIIDVYPLLDIVKIALRPYSSLFTSDLSLIPKNATLENFRFVLFDRPFMTWLRNSLIVSLSASVIGVAVSITAAYAFSRFKFVGRQISMTSFLLTQIFPAPMLLLPTFILLKNFDLINSFMGLIVPYVATAVPISVWVLKGYFDTIPISIEESARIDGANLFQMLTRIVVPLSLPALGVVTLNSFMMAWNEYIIGRVVMPAKDMATLPVGLVGMTGSFRTEWGIYSAGSLLAAIPVMLVFMSLSKVLINGLTLGGVKG